MTNFPPVNGTRPSAEPPVEAPTGASARNAGLREQAVRVAMTLSVGLAGGMVANLLTLPLPWLIGSMLCTIVLALAGVRVHMPRRLANSMTPILGVWLGSSFTPELLGQMIQWYPSVIGLFGWMLASGASGFIYMRKVGKLDHVTAFFSAMPGGLNDMTLIGTAMGGDPRIIPLIHSTRLVATILIIPFWFRFVNHVPPSSSSNFVGMFDLAMQDYAILVACAVVGVLAAVRLRIPAPFLIGAMALSAAAHISGITASRPPTLLVSGAQLLIGASIGVRFAGVSLVYIGRTVWRAIITTLMILACTVIFALAVHEISGESIPVLVLAYSPGGLSEMSLIAIALGIDPAFVAVHHLVRVVAVVSVVPMIFRIFFKPLRTGEDR